MIIDYTKNIYDLESINLIISLFDNLIARGFIFSQVRFEIQRELKREFIKLDSHEEFIKFLNFIKDFKNNNILLGNSVLILKNIITNVSNISNEFISWNTDFSIEITQTFNTKFTDSKKLDNLRQKGIDIHVNRYKNLFLYFINLYLESIQSLIRQRELTSVDFNLSRYVDQFYVTDIQGIDNSYVFP